MITGILIAAALLDREEMTPDQQITAKITVKNTGTVAGTETVQLYLHDVAASVVRPVKELKDFQKITLQPGEEKVVKFVITEPKLRFLTADHGYESEAGMFEVYVGTDSMAEEKRMFRLEK